MMEKQVTNQMDENREQEGGEVGGGAEMSRLS